MFPDALRSNGLCAALDVSCCLACRPFCLPWSLISRTKPQAWQIILRLRTGARYPRCRAHFPLLAERGGSCVPCFVAGRCGFFECGPLPKLHCVSALGRVAAGQRAGRLRFEGRRTRRAVSGGGFAKLASALCAEGGQAIDRLWWRAGGHPPSNVRRVARAAMLRRASEPPPCRGVPAHVQHFGISCLCLVRLRMQRIFPGVLVFLFGPASLTDTLRTTTRRRLVPSRRLKKPSTARSPHSHPELSSSRPRCAGRAKSWLPRRCLVVPLRVLPKP